MAKRGRSPKSRKYIYVPVFFAMALTVFAHVFFPDSAELPTSLMALGLVVCGMDERFKQIPVIMYDIVMWSSVAIVIASIIKFFGVSLPAYNNNSDRMR